MEDLLCQKQINHVPVDVEANSARIIVMGITM